MSRCESKMIPVYMYEMTVSYAKINYDLW